MPDGHMATFHEGTCCVGKKQAVVTEPRDYRWVNGRPMVPTAEVEVSPRGARIARGPQVTPMSRIPQTEIPPQSFG